MIKKYIFLTLSLLWIGGLTGFCQEKATDPNTPNFLILVADDAGWRDFGCYYNEVIRTPNIDRLAQSGLRATNAFLTTPQCSPSRISILTGKYAHATGAEDLHTPLPEGQVFVPTHLKKAGYFTGHLRKTHYGPNGEKQFEWYSENLNDFPKFLDAKGERPFFMWVGFVDPHRPYGNEPVRKQHDPATIPLPPYLADDLETRTDLADYYDEIARMDSVIGSYVRELERRNLRDNTLIIFLSDNGAPFPREKGALYDGGIKTPLIFSWPAAIPAETTFEGLMSVIDLAPTFLELAGVAVPLEMQGNNIAAILKNPSLPGREFVFSERNWHNCDEHIRSVRTSRFKLIHNAYTELPHGTAADITGSPSWQSLYQRKQEGTLTEAQSLLFEVPRPRIELYDLENDPWEIHNIAGEVQHRELVQELFGVLEKWQKETGDFSPEKRRRDDNVDRITGVKFTKAIPPMRDF